MTSNAEKFTWQRVLEVRELTPTLFTFRLTRDDAFRFTAGQFARLGVTGTDGEVVWRAYSMVSSPYDEFLEFFSVVVPDGAFTQPLSNIQVGDQLRVDRQAFGFLTLDRFVDGRDLWLLATGTGLAPYLSILQDFEVWERFERIVLVYSVRTEQELAYQSLIRELPLREHVQAHGHKLTYVPIVTREPVAGALSQRLTDVISNGTLEQAANLALTPEHSRIMLCGNPQMIDEVRGLLKQRDLQLSLSRRPGQVAVETYW